MHKVNQYVDWQMLKPKIINFFHKGFSSTEIATKLMREYNDIDFPLYSDRKIRHIIEEEVKGKGVGCQKPSKIVSDEVKNKLDPLNSIIGRYFNISQEAIKMKRNFHEIVVPRRWFDWLAVKVYNENNEISLAKIGAYTNRDHSSVLYSKKVVNNNIDIYKKDKETSTFLLNAANKLSYFSLDDIISNQKDSTWVFNSLKEINLINHILNEDKNIESFTKHKIKQSLERFKQQFAELLKESGSCEKYI